MMSKHGKRHAPCRGKADTRPLACSIGAEKWIKVFSVFVILLFHALSPAFGNGFEHAVDPASYAQVILQVPYGIKNSGVKNSTGLLVQDSAVESLFIVESYNPMPLEVDLTIEIPKPLEPQNTLETVEIREDDDRYVLNARFKLVTEFDDWYKLVSIRVPANTRPGAYSIKAEACFTGMIDEEHGDFVIKQQATVRVVTPAELKNILTVPAIKIPADSDGNFDEKFSENSLLLRSDLGFFGKIFGSREVDDMAPVSFAGIKMKNLADEDAVALVTWEVLDPKTKKEIEGFRISQAFLDRHGGGDDRIYTQVFVPGRGETKFVLPVFVDKDEVLAGRYLGRVAIKLFGSDATIRTKCFDLTVQKMTWSSVGITVYAIMVTLGFGIFLLTRHRMIWQGFKTRWLILIALFGTAKFLISLVPRFFLTEIFNGLLGPFAAFATGFFREGATCLFVMALVVLIPRPGVVTLSMLMSLVLFCLLGNFNPVVILFIIVSMSTMEIALYLTGFTRRQAQNFTRTKKAMISAAVGLGAAGAFATFVDYNLYMLLYRLYYAKWYIWANIIVVGFVYTAIAAPLGVMLGNKLKQVAIE
jgi:hypothetical protein